MEKQANNSVMQLTLREMQQQILNPKFGIVFGALILVLIAAGPFGTLARFGLLERAGYWLIVAPMTFLIADFCATYLAITLHKLNWNKWLIYLVAGLLAGAPVGLFLWGFDWLIGPSEGGYLRDIGPFILNAIFVSLPVTLVYALGFRDDDNQPSDDAAQEPAFLKRIPKHLGKDLILLNAQDHYIQIVTSKGKELILMRLSDAINELENFEGLQTHRSWWVAKKHIHQIKKSDGKKFAVLSNGTEVPISRSYAQNVQNILD